MSKPKKFDQIKIVRDFVVANIKVIGSNQKEFMRHLETSQNVVLALMRYLKIDAKEFAVFVKDTKANNEYSEVLSKELGLGVFNEEKKDATTTTSSRVSKKKS